MLAIILNLEQKSQIAQSLEKLFIFQSKKYDKPLVGEWTEEISKWGYSLPVILSAIRRLNDADVGILKLPTIKTACHEIAVEAVDSYKEKDCDSGKFFQSPEYQQTRKKLEYLKQTYGENWWKHMGEAKMIE